MCLDMQNTIAVYKLKKEGMKMVGERSLDFEKVQSCKHAQLKVLVYMCLEKGH